MTWRNSPWHSIDSILAAMLRREAVASTRLDKDRDGQTWALEDDEREDA